MAVSTAALNFMIEPAVQHVQKKQRCDEATYHRFREILGKYHTTTDVVDDR
jgi:paired amphipathic helix protein Sin3a